MVRLSVYKKNVVDGRGVEIAGSFNFNYKGWSGNRVVYFITNIFSYDYKVNLYPYNYFRRSDFFFLTFSPWPFFAAWSAFIMVIGVASFFSLYSGALVCLFTGLFLVVLVAFLWFRDLIRELTFLKRYSNRLGRSLNVGFWLFIASETMLFFSLFWSFFHFSLEPAIQIGCIWPPFEGIQTDSLRIPSWNTIILLTSGVALTWAQYSLFAADTRQFYFSSLIVFFCASLFLLNQFNEYAFSFSQINDAVFGTTLYMLTLFHGAHVVIGALYLFYCWWRALFVAHFYPRYTKAEILAGWYWHFVDIVWIFVYINIYIWPVILFDIPVEHVQGSEYLVAVESTWSSVNWQEFKSSLVLRQYAWIIPFEFKVSFVEYLGVHNYYLVDFFLDLSVLFNELVLSVKEGAEAWVMQNQVQPLVEWFGANVIDPISDWFYPPFAERIPERFCPFPPHPFPVLSDAQCDAIIAKNYINEVVEFSTQEAQRASLNSRVLSQQVLTEVVETKKNFCLSTWGKRANEIIDWYFVENLHRFPQVFNPINVDYPHHFKWFKLNWADDAPYDFEDFKTLVSPWWWIADNWYAGENYWDHILKKRFGRFGFTFSKGYAINEEWIYQYMKWFSEARWKLEIIRWDDEYSHAHLWGYIFIKIKVALPYVGRGILYVTFFTVWGFLNFPWYQFM